MEKREDHLLSESVGKTISVYYNDTLSSVSFKTGLLLDFDGFGLKILEQGKTVPLLIPKDKCIRLKVEGGNKK